MAKGRNYLTKYDQRIITRALDLYNTKVNGRKVYLVGSIPDLLRQEFGDHLVGKLTRATIYFWVNRYDVVRQVEAEGKTI